MIAEAALAEVDLDTGSAAPESKPEPLRAVHTANFPDMLRRLGCSLLVTTYQAGKFVLVREEGDHLSTHFRGAGPRAHRVPCPISARLATLTPLVFESFAAMSRTSTVTEAPCTVVIDVRTNHPKNQRGDHHEQV